MKNCLRRLFVVAALLFAAMARSECMILADAAAPTESSDTCSYHFNPSNFSSSRFAGLISKLAATASEKKRVIKFDSGAYLFDKAINFSGPFGWSITILGEGSQSTKLVFQNVHGVDLEGPVGLGLLDKITLNGNGQKGRVNDPLLDKYGVLARRGATIKLGRDVVVEEFSRAGVQAFMGSTIFANGVVSRNNGSDGFVASYNSTVYADAAQSLGNRGVGFFCEATSSIFAANSIAAGSLIDREKGQSRGGDGFVAILNGVIVADRAKLYGNEDQDFVALKGGLVSAGGATTDRPARVLIKDRGDIIGIGR